MRLAKFLATAGVASRRAAEEIVRAGRVTVNGEAVTDPARDVGDADAVALDGAPVDPDAERRRLRGQQARRGGLHRQRYPPPAHRRLARRRSALRLYPVGRLDIDTTGPHPADQRRGARPPADPPQLRGADGPIGRCWRGRRSASAALRALRAGVELEDGRTAPARVRRLAPDTLELTIHEGRKRQVKRMCEAVGHPVRSLTRVSFGPLRARRPGRRRPPPAHRGRGAGPQRRWWTPSATLVEALSDAGR